MLLVHPASEGTDFQSPFNMRRAPFRFSTLRGLQIFTSEAGKDSEIKAPLCPNQQMSLRQRQIPSYGV